MSLRQYRPRKNARRGISSTQSAILLALLAVAILFQISYPLVDGNPLRIVTILTVYSGAAVMLVHSYLSYGWRYFFTYLVITFFFALAIEQIGVRTGWPFGKYIYDESLGIQIAGVPLVVPFAWIMMTHPLLIAARRLTPHWVFLYGGAGLMAWDLFLDPQMVSAGRWTWTVTGAHIPFQPEIPLSNAAGWLFAGMGLMALLHLILPKERRKVGASSLFPDLFLGWTLFSGIVGNVFFFDRPGVALLGGLTFGALLAPYFFSISLGRPEYL